MEAGIEEFAACGLDRGAMSRIAAKAGMSVGVIYKYYEDKDAFFLACVQYSLRLLESVMAEVVQQEEDLWSCVETLVHTLVREAHSHPAYYVLYNEITSGSCQKYAKVLAEQIEATTAGIYAELMQKAQAKGSIHTDGDPAKAAFFFDNLLMMLQFSFSCEYYRERMKIFCGPDSVNHPEEIGEAFLKFLKVMLGEKS
jgi:AcrR family transcriptional regulator